MDQFSALRAFVIVGEEDSFVKAGAVLGVATSSVTRQVNNLEEHLGVKLLHRSTRSVTLTDVGETYLADVSRILEDLDQANRSVMDTGRGPRGLLRVSAPLEFARIHIAPFLKEFGDLYPDLELEMDLSNRVINLAEERIDVAIRVGQIESMSLIARRLAGHRRILCASEGYFDQYGIPEEPEDLNHHNCISFVSRAGGRNWHFDRGAEKHTVKVKGNMRANNSEILRQSALLDGGLILAPDWLVGCDVSCGQLKQVLADWEVTTNTKNGDVSAVYLPHHRGSQKIKAFVDFLKAKYEPTPYWVKNLASCDVAPNSK